MEKWIVGTFLILSLTWANENCNYSIKALQDIQELLGERQVEQAQEILTTIIEGCKKTSQVFIGTGPFFLCGDGGSSSRNVSYGKAMTACYDADYTSCDKKTDYVDNLDYHCYYETVVLGIR